MRRSSWIPWLLACASCTSPNPAYDVSSGDGSPSDGTSGETTASTETSGPVSIEGTASGAVDGTGTSSGTSSSGDVPVDFDPCRAQLYGVSQFRGLFLIDLEARAAMEVLDTPPSIAVATHPETGELWINLSDTPDQLLRLGPTDFVQSGAVLVLPPGVLLPLDGPVWPTFARAAFDAQSNLWLGGYTTGHFLRYHEGNPAITDWILGDLPQGGDMVMLSELEAIVLTNMPPGLHVVFDAAVPSTLPISITGVPADAPLTGLAFAGGELWASAGFTQMSQDSMMLRLEPTGNDSYAVTDMFSLDVRIDDLSPVIVSPSGC